MTSLYLCLECLNIVAMRILRRPQIDVTGTSSRLVTWNGRRRVLHRDHRHHTTGQIRNSRSVAPTSECPAPRPGLRNHGGARRKGHSPCSLLTPLHRRRSRAGRTAAVGRSSAPPVPSSSWWPSHEATPPGRSSAEMRRTSCMGPPAGLRGPALPLRMEKPAREVGDQHRQPADTCRAHYRKHRVDVRDPRGDPTRQRQCRQHDQEGHERT
jgi:hypothetical protein